MTEDAIKIIGARIRQARIERGWTQTDLASRAGVTAKTVGKVEHGNPTVVIGTVFELAAIVGAPLVADTTEGLRRLVEQADNALLLLPSRVRKSGGAVRDDF